MENVKEKLESELATADWEELKPHFQREALIMVAPEQSLVSVGVAFFHDNKEVVEKWLSDGTISKCSPAQAQEFENSESPINFEYLILQPFVLVKRIRTDFH